MKNKKLIKKIKLLVAVVIAILLWQFAAMKVNLSIILPTPMQVANRVWELLFEKEFISVLSFSFGKIISGFLAGVLFGCFFAIIAGKWENAEILFKPFVSTMKAVPVASFVVLSLIYFGSENLSAFISFLMVLPIVYINVLQGIKSIDVKMTEMAKVFRLSFFRRLKYLILPSVLPFLVSGSAVASGLAWKSGIAAEIIGVPEGSIGEALFDSKVYLETEALLAWTVVIVALSIGTEKLFSLAIKGLFSVFFVSPIPKTAKALKEIKDRPQSIKFTNVSKSFGEEKVIDNFSAEFSEGVNVLFGKSGSGKTTLLNMILGLEKADDGKIEGIPEKISVVFQEDRLSSEFTPMGNVLAVTGKSKSGNDILHVFSHLGLERKDVLRKKVSKLSGGMKRRVAICRALCAEGEVLILDEPFSGLDDKTKDNVIETVKKCTSGKIVILVTHDEEEAEKMGAVKVIRL